MPRDLPGLSGVEEGIRQEKGGESRGDAAIQPQNEKAHVAAHERKISMVDREKIWKGIVACERCDLDKCPYSTLPPDECFKGLCMDVLAMMDEAKPIQAELEGGGGSWWYVCGECHTAINYKDNYCRECGRKQNWEGL